MTEDFAEVLRSARLEKGWDQAQFARQLGTVSQQTVSRWERGISRPRKAMIPEIAKVLDIEVGRLLVAYERRSIAVS